MKIAEIISKSIRWGLLYGIPVFIAIALSAPFQDPSMYVLGLFGQIIGGFGIAYILTGFIIRSLRRSLSAPLIAVGVVLLATGAPLSIFYYPHPMEHDLPDTLSYYKLVRMEPVHDENDPAREIGYEYVDIPFTSEEVDTLCVILRAHNKEFVVGNNGEILISKRATRNADDMMWINVDLDEKMREKTSEMKNDPDTH